MDMARRLEDVVGCSRVLTRGGSGMNEVLSPIYSKGIFLAEKPSSTRRIFGPSV